jgi:hypothetical protein
LVCRCRRTRCRAPAPPWGQAAATTGRQDNGRPTTTPVAISLAPTIRPARRASCGARQCGHRSPRGGHGHRLLLWPHWRQKYPNNVWSGRASQEVFVELSVIRSCINVSGLSLERMLRATMDISAPAFSLPAKPQVGYLGYQCAQAPGRPFLQLFSSSRRPRREIECGATSSLAP